MEKFSCVIIGAGPAGLQSGLFLGRASVSTLVIGVPEKSDLYYGKIIGNFFGAADEPSGAILLDNGVEHLKKYGVRVLKEEVVDLQVQDGGIFKIVTESQQEFSADAVIIATGQSLVKAGILNEQKFFGNGVHTCVACDGPLVKGKKIGVIGSGSHAVQEAIELLTFTDKVTIFTQGAAPVWSKELDAMIKQKNITVSDLRMKALKGETKIEAAVFSDGTEEPFDGIFIALGAASSVTFSYKLGLEQQDGFLKIDRDGKTNMEGIWAAGAATGGNPQIAKSVGEGCNAALSIIKKLKGIPQYKDQT